MYELTDGEYRKCTSNNLFRMACEKGFRWGFSKEQMLSELLMLLLDEREESEKKRLEEMMLSTKPIIQVLCKSCPNVIRISDTTCPHCGEGQ